MSAAEDRIGLLRDMMLEPLRTGPSDLAIEAIAPYETGAGWAESLRESFATAPDAFGRGAWAGYKLAFGIFEQWLGMTGNCATAGRFAVHSNSDAGLSSGPIRVASVRDGKWTDEKEDGGSCNG